MAKRAEENPAVPFLSRLGFEIGNNPLANRKYLAELLVAYTFLVLAFYVGTTLIAPLLIKSGNEFIRGSGALNYIVNLYMCHQMPERSFFIFGEPMPLCERCFAIFVGALIAYPSAVIRSRFPKFMQSWAFVILALIPIGVDGVTQLMGMRESNSFERVSTGFIAAFAVTYFLITTVLERYETGKALYRRGIAFPVLIPSAMLLLPLLIASVFVGTHYMSADHALENARQETPGAAVYEVHYLPPHAAQSIPADVFLSSYSDPVLKDVAKNRVFYSHSFGVWVALALNSTPERYGNYSYFSKATGDYYYYDAWNEELILKAGH